VKAACRLLADSEEYTHKVLVVNEINELWNEALSTHRILGEVLSQSVATSIFLTGKNYSGEIIQWLGTTDIDIVDCHAVGPEKSFDMLQKLTRTNSLIVFLWREQWSMKFLKRLVN
jgi:UDP-N-acetylmuramyl pentapeptide synthase